MQKKRLVWHLFPSFLLITLVSLLAIYLYAVRSVHKFYLRELAEELQVRASLFDDHVTQHLKNKDYKALDALAKSLGAKSETRITVILPNGKVVADSDHDPLVMDFHDDRPEIRDVLAGKNDLPASSIRHSYTLNQNMLYVAAPVTAEGQVTAVLRMAMPVGQITSQLDAIYLRIAVGGMIVALLAAGLSLYIARRISRPLEEMKEGAERFARGELSWRLPVPETLEMGALAEAMNMMAAQLDHRIRTLMHQRNEQEAVLSSMVEGVLAIDMDERIISINEAGAELLGVEHDKAQGQSIQAVIRNTELQELVARTLGSREQVEGDIVLRDSAERYLQAHGTILHDAHDRGMGAVIVLNDVTRLRRLETVRRDFVANVSHELKTPITSIKGFVETLLDGALNNPEDAERFLKIVARQTDRLNAIIEDILSLSRIEDQTEKDKIVFEKCQVREVLESAIQLCELQARSRKIDVELICDESIATRLNAPLMEQAIVNLVDNAIKYSEEGKVVRVQAQRNNGDVTICVSDKGGGIASEHLQRIFERFYRADKARSRNLGGTGLGLAIVKHIVLVHQGSIAVDSKLGKGTTFTIHVPTAEE
jgi:two-component system phosphate regulon sensor histidine kinase PhoR